MFVCEGVKTQMFVGYCVLSVGYVCVFVCRYSSAECFCVRCTRSGLSGADSDLDLMNFNPCLLSPVLVCAYVCLCISASYVFSLELLKHLFPTSDRGDMFV